jgi:hypothetical protein
MIRWREYKRRFTRAVFNGLVRDAQRNVLLDKLRAAEPPATYCDCLNFAIRNGSQKAPEYAAHLFREIFGTWPRSCDRGPPAPLPNLPNLSIDEWVALRKRKVRPRSNQRCAASLYTEDAKSRDPSP